MRYRQSNGVLAHTIKDEKPTPVIPKWRVPEWFSQLDSEALNKLSLYHKEIIRFNDKINLISPTTKENADEIHFADSIIACSIIGTIVGDGEVYDIGSGNGFPGIIFSILNPRNKVILVDSDQRKCEFLKIMVGRLKLDNCSVVNTKLENLADNSIQYAVSRAFAPLGKGLVLSRKKLVLGGSYFNLKTDSWGSEISNLPVQVCSFWANELVGEYELPESKKRLFVVASKKVS